MALTDDQRAMLRLLAQREQGYEDIAALMGLSVDEVRAKVKEALAEVDESGQGAADTEEAAKAPAVEPEKPTEAEKPPPAKEPKPEEPVEKATEESPQPATRPSPAAKPSFPRQSRIRLPRDQRLLAGGLAGIVTVVLILVLALSGGGGSSSPIPTTTSASGGSEGTGTTTANSSLTGAVLKPVDGSSAKGLALFGRDKNKVALEVEAQGLEPSATGESYAIWLARSPKSMVPIASAKVDKSGRIASRYLIPNEVLAFLASGAFNELAVTRVNEGLFRAGMAKARKEKKAPAYTGAAVLRGEVTGPIVGAAVKKQGGG